MNKAQLVKVSKKLAPTARQSFNLDWLEKKNLNHESMKLFKVVNNDTSPELNKGDFVLVDTSSTGIVNGRYHAFIIDGEFHTKRLNKLPNGDLTVVCCKGKQLIKQSDPMLFIPLGLVVHRQGEL